jgi:hypothetical protein
MFSQSAFLVMLRKIPMRPAWAVKRRLPARPSPSPQDASGLKIVAKRVGVFSILFAIVFAHLGTCRGNG